jgi:hypothetical protein
MGRRRDIKKWSTNLRAKHKIKAQNACDLNGGKNRKKINYSERMYLYNVIINTTHVSKEFN